MRLIYVSRMKRVVELLDMFQTVLTALLDPSQPVFKVIHWSLCQKAMAGELSEYASSRR